MRSNTFLVSLALIGLFVVSLVAGYYAGERFFKPQPVPTPGLVARPEPPPPTAPPTPSATRPRAVRATPQAPEPPAMRQTPAAPEPPSPAVSPPATPAGAGRTPAARATERETPRAEGPLYRVQVGAFASRENADAKLQQLRADGFSPYLVREGGLFKVRVGAFRDRERAEELAERLRARGYQVVIVR